MTNAAKMLVWDRQQEPFGEVNLTAATVTTPLRFPGQLADAESELNYNMMRDYDPSLGRYIQADPIGLYGGINLYGYVGGNPVRYIDLWGLEACPAGMTIFCIARTPPIKIDPEFIGSGFYQPKYDFSGLGYAPYWPDKPHSGLTKWGWYDCKYGVNGTCSFVGPGVAEDQHGIETKPLGDGMVPICAKEFEVNPKHPSGDVDQPFLDALKKGYQCIPGPNGGCVSGQ